jgi:prepilin-type N-terminal cleavage/methylation domain-containing protein
VSDLRKTEKSVWRREPPGFSLLELLAAMALLLLVSGVVMSALMRMINTQGTISNRTELHSSVRSATELIQQEIGQAGRISLGGAPVTLSTPVLVASVGTVSFPVGVTCPAGTGCTNGMFVNEWLVIDAGANRETVELTAVTSTSISAMFNNAAGHASGAPVSVLGAFSSGVIPTAASPASYTDGSTGSVLKLFGDINDDGKMVYIEYTCDTNSGNLYRQVLAYDAAPASKVSPPNSSMILLPNILANPGGTPCFTYQQKSVTAPGGVVNWYVVNVAVTLTVQTQNPDPQTHQYQTETKALLNVSPRNVFECWQLASGLVANRIQPIPSSVTSLLQ